MNLQPCPHLPGDPLVSDALCARRHTLGRRYTAPDEIDLAISYRPCVTCARGAAAVADTTGGLSRRMRLAADAVGSRERGVAAMTARSQAVYDKTYVYLQRHPGQTVDELASGMRLKRPTATRRLKRMHEMGRVLADGHRLAQMRWYARAA